MNGQKIDGKYFYWLKSSRTEKKTEVQISERINFAISDNFS